MNGIQHNCSFQATMSVRERPAALPFGTTENVFSFVIPLTRDEILMHALLGFPLLLSPSYGQVKSARPVIALMQSRIV